MGKEILPLHARVPLAPPNSWTQQSTTTPSAPRRAVGLIAYRHKHCLGTAVAHVSAQCDFAGVKKKKKLSYFSPWLGSLVSDPQPCILVHHFLVCCGTARGAPQMKHDSARRTPRVHECVATLLAVHQSVLPTSRWSRIRCDFN